MKTANKIILTFILMLLISPCFASKSIYQQNLELANLGDSTAQYNLGYMFHMGEGVSRDYKKAMEWYSKAAAQGDIDAYYNLGIIYLNGEGIQQNYEKAFQLFYVASTQGDADATFNVAYMYKKGLGREKNLAQANAWYLKAAKLGEAQSQFYIGINHLMGRNGLTQDTNLALNWLTQSAANGNTKAKVIAYFLELFLSVF